MKNLLSTTTNRLAYRFVAIVICLFFISAFVVNSHAGASTAKNQQVTVNFSTLKDQHHYYQFSGQLIDPAGHVAKEIYIVWSIAGENNWTETAATLVKKSMKTAKWNFNVNIPSKADVDQNGVIYMILIKQGDQSSWITNQGAYFLVGGKTANVNLGAQNVLLQTAEINSFDQLKGTIIVKNFGFGATVSIQFKTNQSKAVKIVKAKRLGSLAYSNGTLHEYAFETDLDEMVESVQLVAVYKVNDKTYKDPESSANQIVR